MRIRAILLVSFLLIAVLSAKAQPGYFQQRVDTRLEVRLDDTANFLHGYEDLDYYNNSPDTLHYIYFHLWPNAYANDRTAYTKQAVENHDTKFYFSKEKDRGFIDSLSFEVDGIKAGIAATNNIDIVKLLLPQPLAPGDKINITTPFRVKIPYTFSRFGHVGQSYQVSQWFPKPAVYDRKGWHPIPYLDQGEFFSEYGSYDVQITIPKNYIVMATGNLQNGEELQWLDSLSKAPLPPDTIYKNSQPLSSPETKTLHYTENNIHDFAWFADKTWIVRKDTVTVPQNDKTVTAYTAFFPKDEAGWENGTQSLITTVKELSRRVGPYPYKTIKAVEGALSAGGGMEYPTITVVSPSNSEPTNHTVIVHEAGHNWFYGMLGSDERDYPWMDEGINSYYEQVITDLRKANDTQKTTRQDRLMATLNNRHLNALAFTYPMSIHEDLPAGAGADTFPSLNYDGDVYEKTPYLMRWLRAYMGADSFDAAMHDYFNQFQYKHPYPEDFQRIFQQHTTKNLDWFFINALNSGKPVNFAIKNISKHSGITVDLKNKTGMNAAVPVYLLKDSNDTLFTFSRPFTNTTTVNFPGESAYKKIWIGDEVPDYDLRNNSSDRHFKIRPFLGLNMDTIRRMWVMPSLGYNYYDGFMLGILLHNITVPQNKFQYLLAPMFAFGSKTFAGTGQIGYTSYFSSGWLHDIQWNLEGKTFSYDKNSLNIDKNLYARYVKVAPEIILNIRRPYARSTVERKLSIKGYFISEQQLAFNQDPVDSLYRPRKNGFINNLYARVRYTHENHRTFNPFSYAFEGQAGKDFAKITAEGTLKVDYFTKGKALYLRVFGGKFFNFANNEYDASRYWLATAYSGVNDYLYDGTYLGRNESTGFVAQQVAMEEGGFKMRTQQYANPIGLSNNWLFAFNVKTDLPLGKIPLRAYASVATFTDAQKLNPSGAKALYETGLELSITKYISVYFPVFVSKDFKDYSKSILGKNAYWKTLSFSLNIQDVDWFNLPKGLLKL